MIKFVCDNVIYTVSLNLYVVFSYRYSAHLCGNGRRPGHSIGDLDNLKSYKRFLRLEISSP